MVLDEDPVLLEKSIHDDEKSGDMEGTCETLWSCSPLPLRRIMSD